MAVTGPPKDPTPTLDGAGAIVTITLGTVTYLRLTPGPIEAGYAARESGRFGALGTGHAAGWRHFHS